MEVPVTAMRDFVADMVWPALILEQRLISVIPICIGLVVEWLALRFGGFGLSWKRAAIVDVAMNAVSAVVGIPVIPLLGLAWEVVPGQLLYRLNIGTFNPITWLATLVIATVVTALIEAGVVAWGFKLAITRKRFGVLFLANGASIGIAFASLLLHPPRL
jgi:hypothetical protein